MRPILLAFSSTNQTLPSGPAVMPSGLLLAVGIPNVEKLPLGVMRPIAPLLNSVNQRLPAIRPGRDAARSAIGCGDRELGDSGRRSDTADLARALRDLREPQGAIWPGG